MTRPKEFCFRLFEFVWCKIFDQEQYLLLDFIWQIAYQKNPLGLLYKTACILLNNSLFYVICSFFN